MIENGDVSFNPCFNGYSTLTNQGFNNQQQAQMSFNPCFNGYSTLTFQLAV